jgi:predicted MPP superfamily phosphohydrolase
MRNSGTWWIIAGIMVLLDFYVFQALKTVTQNASERVKAVVHITYWVLAAATVILLLSLPYIQALQTNKFFRNYIFAIMLGLFIAKLIGVAFFLIDDLRRLVLWVVAKLSPATGAHYADPAGNGISRSVFLSWLGLGAGTAVFGSLLYGFTNKYNYQVKKIQLAYANLPLAFKGMKIVHISDIHSGSFQNKEAVNKGIDLILKQDADLILFTGDLVNDRHDEMDDYLDVFNRLKAPLGVYSTLGNHDYGDYVAWPSEQAKVENLNKLKGVHSKLGWRLLMNEHVLINKGDDSIALLGIENWGAKGRFPKYGKMKEAYPGSEEIPFKILMSHDPSHWDAQVRTEYKDIDLMLAGHTHGMQFGIENPYFKWSPVQWMYKQWAGLYEEGNQKLYVNRGFGFIGYPGRVGVLPEITVIELV